MLKQLKRAIAHVPALDRRLKVLYYGFREGIERYLLGTRVQEYLWRRRGLHLADNAEAAFWTAVQAPHREVVVERIRALVPPGGSVLDIGCGGGANLYALARALPGGTYHGLDLNREVVAQARSRFAALGMTNVTVGVGRADALPAPSGTFDVVLTDAVLMYIGPDKIAQVLTEMVRVARGGVVLSEWQGATRGDSTYRFGHWVHDFPRLLRAINPDLRVEAVRYPRSCWEDRDWLEFGSVITAVR